MKKNTLLIAVTVLTLAFNPVNAQSPTVFEWETAVRITVGDNYVTETIDGITVTATSSDANGARDASVIPGEGYGGSTGFIVTFSGTEITFTFDRLVDVNSILAIESGSLPITDYVFIPTGGNNPTVITTVDESATATLNWVGVTSFTVIATSPAFFSFDDLSVSENSLGVNDAYASPKAKVYPNPAENILNIKNVTDLKSTDIYNSLGQLVLQSKEGQIDVSHLSKGMYFLKINSRQGMETKRIIKK